MEQAMADTADRYEFVIRWQPFLLKPETPPEGELKPKSTAEKPRIPAYLKNAGDDVGLNFTGKCDRYPDTVPSHALLEYAKEKDWKKQDELSELIFQSYFTDGVHLDADALVSLAKKVGLDEKESRKVVTDADWLKEAREEVKNWRRKGVNAVPCFFMNDQRTFSGAQSKEAFIKMFDLVTEKFPLEG